jgi:RHS repeat-associated protein
MTNTILHRLRPAAAAALLLAVASPALAQQLRSYHLDALGSVRAISDANGLVVERHDYLPFGEECTTGTCGLNPGVGAGGPRKFTGKERDAETGLDYFGARYYAAKAARFTSVDPVYTWQDNLADPVRWNRYAYSRNNPLRYTDPDGRTIVDYLNGVANAVGSNFLLGAGRVGGGNADYQFGQFVGDVFSIPAGAVVVQGGLGPAGLGIVGAPETGGASLVVTAAGVVMVGAGSSAVVNGATNAGVYLSKELGSIYKVPGSATTSGKPYVGRHNKPDPAKTRRSRDGRDRTQAEVVDTYDPADTHEGRVKEQRQIDAHGLENLDNKRNEIRKE